MIVEPSAASAHHWQLDAETVVVRSRWIGVLVGFVLANVVDFGGDVRSQGTLNALLSVGAAYALIDGLWRRRGQVFLSRWPLVISALEAAFIGLLCYFDRGVESPFFFYYLLSLVCCAIRYAPAVTYATFGIHAVSYAALSAATLPAPAGRGMSEDWVTVLSTLVVMGWVTWTSVALAALFKRAEDRLKQLNTALLEEQARLEERIVERSQELRQTQALVLHQEKMAAVGLLAAGIAHEVGNPLASISSLVQMLQLRQRDAYSQEKLTLVSEQLRRIQGILRELIDFSRPASRQRSRVHLQEVIETALNVAKYYKPTKDKQIEIVHDPAVPPLRTVRDAMVQVLLNLILNAMDAAPKGGTIRLETKYANGMVDIRVGDNGPGISPAHRQRVFEPYFTTKDHGTGLGLFVSRHMVQEMGGRLELETAEPGQTTFLVALPLAEAAGNVERSSTIAPGAGAGFAHENAAALEQAVVPARAGDVFSYPSLHD